MENLVQQFPPFREAEAAPGHGDHGHHEHHEPSFWSKYIFSTDHKIIGLQYGLTALCFMLFGFGLMILMRWQIAHPRNPGAVDRACCWKKLSARSRPGGALFSPELYNSFGAMHGTIMVFLGIDAAGVRGVRQLRRAADDRRAGHDVSARQTWRAITRYFIGGLVMLVSFFIPGRRGAGGLDVLSPRWRQSDSGPTASFSGSSA